MDFGQVAVEIGAQDFAAGVEAVAVEPVLQFRRADLGVVSGEPAARFAPALVAIDGDELAAQFGGGEEVGVGAGDGLGGELDGAFTALELLGDRFQHGGPIGAAVEHPGVVGHAQGIPLGIDAPVAFAVLLPQVFLGSCGRLILGGELPHASAAADVAGHDRDGGLINQQAAFHRTQLAALGLVENLGDAAIEILEFDRIGHAAKALEGFAHGPHIGEVDRDLDRSIEAFVAAEVEQQLVAINPAAAGVAHLDLHPVGFDAARGDLLPLACRGGADVGDAHNHELVTHGR